jgi:hypothetical protein
MNNIKTIFTATVALKGYKTETESSLNGAPIKGSLLIRKTSEREIVRKQLSKVLKENFNLIKATISNLYTSANSAAGAKNLTGLRTLNQSLLSSSTYTHDDTLFHYALARTNNKDLKNIAHVIPNSKLKKNIQLDKIVVEFMADNRTLEEIQLEKKSDNINYSKFLLHISTGMSLLKQKISAQSSKATTILDQVLVNRAGRENMNSRPMSTKNLSTPSGILNTGRGVAQEGLVEVRANKTTSSSSKVTNSKVGFTKSRLIKSVGLSAGDAISTNGAGRNNGLGLFNYNSHLSARSAAKINKRVSVNVNPILLKNTSLFYKQSLSGFTGNPLKLNQQQLYSSKHVSYSWKTKHNKTPYIFGTAMNFNFSGRNKYLGAGGPSGILDYLLKTLFLNIFTLISNFVFVPRHDKIIIRLFVFLSPVIGKIFPDVIYHNHKLSTQRINKNNDIISNSLLRLTTGKNKWKLREHNASRVLKINRIKSRTSQILEAELTGEFNRVKTGELQLPLPFTKQLPSLRSDLARIKRDRKNKLPLKLAPNIIQTFFYKNAFIKYRGLEFIKNWLFFFIKHEFKIKFLTAVLAIQQMSGINNNNNINNSNNLRAIAPRPGVSPTVSPIIMCASANKSGTIIDSIVERYIVKGLATWNQDKNRKKTVKLGVVNPVTAPLNNLLNKFNKDLNYIVGFTAKEWLSKNKKGYFSDETAVYLRPLRGRYPSIDDYKKSMGKIAKPSIRYNYNLLLHDYFNSFSTLFSRTLTTYSRFLGVYFQTPVQLEIIKLHYPFHDSNILAQILGFNARKLNYNRMLKMLLPKAVVRNPTSILGVLGKPVARSGSIERRKINSEQVDTEWGIEQANSVATGGSYQLRRSLSQIKESYSHLINYESGFTGISTSLGDPVTDRPTNGVHGGGFSAYSPISYMPALVTPNHFIKLKSFLSYLFLSNKYLTIPKVERNKKTILVDIASSKDNQGSTVSASANVNVNANANAKSNEAVNNTSGSEPTSTLTHNPDLSKFPFFMFQENPYKTVVPTSGNLKVKGGLAHKNTGVHSHATIDRKKRNNQIKALLNDKSEANKIILRTKLRKALKTISIVKTPSYLAGLNVRLAGRLMTQPMRPRFTVQAKQHGSLARVKVAFVEKSRYTGKNKRGAFSFTVVMGHSTHL